MRPTNGGTLTVQLPVPGRARTRERGTRLASTGPQIPPEIRRPRLLPRVIWPFFPPERMRPMRGPSMFLQPSRTAG